MVEPIKRYCKTGLHLENIVGKKSKSVYCLADY